GLVLIGILREAHRGLGLAKPSLPAELRPEAERMAADLAPDLPPAVAVAMGAAWAQLFGLVGFGLFGQFSRVGGGGERFFRPGAEPMGAGLAPDLPPAVAVAMVAAWAQLFGLVGFALFGQFNRVVEDRERFFRHAAGQLAHGVGLVYGQQGPNGNGTAPGSGAAAGAGRPAAN